MRHLAIALIVAFVLALRRRAAPERPADYWVFDVCQPDCAFSIRHTDVNDISGLQRRDEVHDDTSAGVIESDPPWS